MEDGWGATSTLCAQFLPCIHNTTCFNKIMTAIQNLILNNPANVLTVAGSYAVTHSDTNSSIVVISLVIYRTAS